jgi:hypothetical protein
MNLQFAKTAPGVMVASWTHPKSGRVYSIAVIESCDAWNTFIDGEWIARDLPSFEGAVAAAETKLSPKFYPNLVRVAGLCLLAVILGASAVVASKLMPANSAAEVAAVTEDDAPGARASELVEKVAPDTPIQNPGVSQQPLPVRRARPTPQPRAGDF